MFSGDDMKTAGTAVCADCQSVTQQQASIMQHRDTE